MSFNLDDPLAGILSDDSDGSFFDDDIIGKKKTPKKKATTPIADKKHSLFDLGDKDSTKKGLFDKKESLFDLEPASTKKPTLDVLSDENFLSKAETTKSPGSFKRTVSKESIKFAADTKTSSERVESFTKSPAKTKASTSADKLNILDDLLEPKNDPPKPLEKGKSSQSLLDDILGPPKTPSSSQTVRPATAAKSQDFDLDTIIGKNEPKQNKPTPKTAPQKQTLKTDNQKESAKKKKSSDDWLGIFQKKDMGENEEEDGDAGMPSWLVGDKKNKADASKSAKDSHELKEQKAEQREGQTATKLVPQTEPDQFKATAETVPSFPQLSIPQLSVPTIQRNLHGSNEDITAEGAAMYLEQQESQLMVALQLKAQEEKLAAMQMRQKEAARLQRDAAQAQHAQVDAILQRHAHQRLQLQAAIAERQDRITQRIKDLLGTKAEDNEGLDYSVDGEGDYAPTSDKRESPHIKEKKQLLQLVQSLQENHDKEIDMMETSYRRQLAFLEISINQSEERMKEESDKLVKYFTEKINWLEEHHHMYKKTMEENINTLAERQKAENEMLRQQHLENIKVLQEHHATLMENIKNAVKQEQILIKDSAGFSANLLELVSDVKENKSQCQLLVDKVENLVENTKADSEKSLQVRETQINDMIQQLKKERENFETEKVESRDLVKMLETRLRQMTSMIEDETASLKQKKMEFEFEKATFSKQTEFAKNVLKKQDEEIKMLRDAIQKEYQEKIAKIDEEKAKALKDAAAIAKEKASIQNLKQELEKTKAELHAQLEEVSEERSKMNLEKQQMHMEEQRILAKSRDLDLLAKTAIEKQTQADKKYAEAELVQKKYEDRIRRLQEHVVSLNAREKQIAKEKVALSRERLSLHNEKKQLESRQHCSLCKPQNALQYNFEQTYSLPDSFLNVPVSKDYSMNTNANYAMNAIEQEMAHIMGRSFGLRHSAGLGHSAAFGHTTGVLPSEDVLESRNNLDSNVHATQATQIESEAFKDLMDPKFMMLRLDVKQVLSNLEQSKKDDGDKTEKADPESVKE